jgi:hypothetical protein
MRRFFLALLGCVALALVADSRPARAQDVECDPGDREVHSLDFVGNRAFTDDQLALRIVTTASTWSRRHLRIFGTRRCLNSDELLRDKYRLQLLYRQAGYYNTKVDTVVTPTAKDEVNVSFIIDEGEPVRITRLTIIGLDSVRDRQDVLSGLWTAVGNAYDITRIEQDVQTVLRRLRNAGYPRPDVLRNYETSTKDSLTAHVELTFLPGPLAHIGAVQVEVTPNDGKQQEILPYPALRKVSGLGTIALQYNFASEVWTTRYAGSQHWPNNIGTSAPNASGRQSQTPRRERVNMTQYLTRRVERAAIHALTLRAPVP